MGSYIKGGVTLLVLIAANMIMDNLTDMGFMDLMFFVGLMISLIIGFFSSTGGFTTQVTDLAVSREMLDSDQYEKKRFKFTANVPFWTALTYTGVGFLAFIIVVITY